MKAMLTAGLLIPDRLTDARVGKSLLGELLAVAPECAPEIFGGREPLDRVFSSIDVVDENWSTPFLWRHKAPYRADGAIWFDNPGFHSALYLSVSAPRDPGTADRLVGFVMRAAAAVAVDLGYVHILSAEERASDAVPYLDWYPLEIGLTTSDLRLGLPRLPWMTLFGRPYTELMGVDLLSRAPWGELSICSEMSLACKLTSSAEEVARSVGLLEERRSAMTEALGQRYFRGHPGVAVPRFNL